MKIERLMFILITLLSKKIIKAKEIAEIYQVSTRTIYRDIDTLSLAGIPIYSQQGTDGGFYIDENYKLNSLLFSEAEKKLIYDFSRSLSKSVKRPQLKELQHKMSTFMTSNEKTSPYFFDFTQWSTKDQKLNLLDKAIDQCNIVHFDYTDYKGHDTRRFVEPINLVCKANVWYLYGFCLLREDTRLFRMSRIQNLDVIDDKFISENHLFMSQDLLDDFFADLVASVEMVHVCLSFKKEVKSRVFDVFSEEVILDEENYLVVSREFAKEPWLNELILSFGSGVKVISPAWLREEIRSEAQKIIDQYDTM